ncbi:MAG: hypothetical protein K2M42_00220 [Oscillospiraceae bacterium]|nr:hypothetical protein [Oscillospiraceae bacterium]
MEEDKRHKRERINENIFVGIVSGVIVLLIGFIGTLIWTYLIFPNLSNPGDNSSSSPAQSVESNPIISTTPLPGPTSTPVLPTQTPSPVPTPAQTPIPLPVSTPIPGSNSNTDSPNTSNSDPGLDGNGGYPQLQPPPINDYQAQDIINAPIPEPPIDD